MKKSIFAALLTAAAVLTMGACNKHSWETTKKIYTPHGHEEGHDHDKKEAGEEKSEEEK